jgi:hypothetical protein
MTSQDEERAKLVRRITERFDQQRREQEEALRHCLDSLHSPTFGQEFEEQYGKKDGRLIAFWEAVECCNLHNEPYPQWVRTMLSEASPQRGGKASLDFHAPGTKGGRYSGAWAKYRQHQKRQYLLAAVAHAEAAGKACVEPPSVDELAEFKQAMQSIGGGDIDTDAILADGGKPKRIKNEKIIALAHRFLYRLGKVLGEPPEYYAYDFDSLESTLRALRRGEAKADAAYLARLRSALVQSDPDGDSPPPPK